MEVQVPHVDAFPHLSVFYFLLPVILASVYLNSLQPSKSQLCKITLGNHKQGERTPCISHTCIKYVFKI